MKKLSFVLFVSFLLSACGSSTPVPPSAIPATATVEVLPTVTPVCIDPKPTQADVDRALGYTGNIFSAPVWEQSYEAYDNKVAVYWVSSDGVVFLEDVIFSCGYEEPDLNRYFSAEHWNTVFANYETYQMTNECKNDNGIRLYEFGISDLGTEYAARYWSAYDSNNSIITLMLLLPASATPVMDEYAAMLFPTFSSCK